MHLKQVLTYVRNSNWPAKITDLGQSEAKFVDKNRKKRVDKGSVKIAGKMNEGQCEKDFQID